MKTLKDQGKKLKDMKKKEDKILEKEEEILDEVSTEGTPRLVPKKTQSKSSKDDGILPYPDEDIKNLV